jgi:DNA-binding NtrC family response regulator
MKTVLVVDDKEMMRDSVGSTLQRAGFRVVTACDGESAVAIISRKRPDAVVSDLKMPGMGGLGLLEKIREIDDELPLVLMTAYGAVDTAVKAIKNGAYDYITKPFEGDELLVAVKRAIRHASLLRENALLKAQDPEPIESTPHAMSAGGGATRFGLDRIIGHSPAMRRVKEQVAAVAESQGTVLVIGESGTGKEVIAKAVHELSTRHDAPLLAVNCAALTESLLESELFGHERGAFTGADQMRKGRFELADNGTLMLDEVSEVGPNIQAKLLRVLQEREFERVGSSVTIGVDVRIIATSNRDLPRSVADGAFRQDLFFRLNVLPVHLPPLRDRIEDLPALADHFLGRICQREGRGRAVFAGEALDLLQSYDWPGNIRELENICERAVVLSRRRSGGDKEWMIPRSLIESWLMPMAPIAIPSFGFSGPIEVDLPMAQEQLSSEVEAAVATHALPFVAPPDATLEEIERETIIQTLGRFQGHRQKTAKALGIGVRTLGLKLKKWKELELVAQSL